jgi:hypothetical protein
VQTRNELSTQWKLTLTGFRTPCQALDGLMLRLVSTGQNYDTPNRLVFVLGAGAMTDYGFPIGWHVGDENELAADNRLVGSSRVFFGVRPDNQISAS